MGIVGVEAVLHGIGSLTPSKVVRDRRWIMELSSSSAGRSVVGCWWILKIKEEEGTARKCCGLGGGREVM